MKKVTRILCLIAVFAICLSLCGCSVLDEIRQTRAIRTESGDIRLEGGAEYKLLPECRELTPMFDEMKTVYVVTEDVPLLLTSAMGEYFDLSDDGIFLKNYVEGEEVYYCRADAYDAVYQRIVSGLTLDKCCYWCYDYNAGRLIPYVLTQAQFDAVNQVCQTQEPQTLPSGAMMDWDYWVALNMCSEDLLFTKVLADICVTDGKYYVEVAAGVDTLLYAVPAELTATFADIMDMFVQTEGEYWEEW